LLTSAPGHSLSILILVIILLKSQLLQFSMHSIHNFLLKAFYLKVFKECSEALRQFFFLNQPELYYNLDRPQSRNQQSSSQGISTSEDLHVCEGHTDNPDKIGHK